MKPLALSSVVPLAIQVAAQSGADSFAERCADLADALTSHLPGTATVRSAEYLAAGTTLTIPPPDATCPEFQAIVSSGFCRVQIQSETASETASASTGSVELEAWLPIDWTGRILTVGNGGLGGCIAYPDMIYGSDRGFAAIGTDNGHTGNNGKPFLDNPTVLEDFAYRALNVGIKLGKQTAASFYGKSHTKSYYLGCSLGGRQGFVEAQSFPEDFDGIVAGAPAFAFTGLSSYRGYAYTITGPPGSPTFLSPELWAVVLEDLLEQCDSLDGHVDGILEDPDLCAYKPEGLICRPGQDSDCLTGTQAETVRNVFAPLHDKNGELVFPGLQPGADSATRLWRGQMFDYSLDWFRYVVYGDPSWNGTIGLDEIEAAQRTEVYGLDAWEGDLSGARDAGAKILHYHGLQDPLISSRNSDRYYGLVARTMGLPPAELDGFYRYFRVSGMGHCAGGTGALNIGNRAETAAGEEPEENVLAAIVAWVEEGEAPEYVLGTAYTDESKEEVAFQRRHCKYPKRNTYTGSGDPNSPDSWECVV